MRGRAPSPHHSDDGDGDKRDGRREEGPRAREEGRGGARAT
jgi:hypothetical protein